LWVCKVCARHFEDDALFENAAFKDTALFFQNRFVRRTVLKGVDFENYPAFNASKSDGEFSFLRARFSVVPDFSQADFKQAPNLDDVNFPHPVLG
jgi:hypothetical protein